MDYMNLGCTGPRVSRLCLGCMSFGDPDARPWALDEARSRPFIKTALDAGINFFDTANVYGHGASERIVGRALKDFARRDDVVIATKVGLPMREAPQASGLSRKAILDAVDASLERLGTDYIDLYQIHQFDEATPIEETLEALNDVVRAGKVRHLGASSMLASRFMQMLDASESGDLSRFVSIQPLYNLIRREVEEELLPFCAAAGIGVIVYSPLARGLLSRGKMQGGGATVRARAEQNVPDDHRRSVVGAIEDIARSRGVGNSQIALAWVLSNSAITSPIIGATKAHHIDDAIAALAIDLSPDEIALLEGRVGLLE